ncbi:MAG TPA: diguanylate cyclase [Pyrinomonadaceae bacterium]|nr:diguanylate cyclase [Pyrinomonadaceae bacterium]
MPRRKDKSEDKATSKHRLLRASRPSMTTDTLPEILPQIVQEHPEDAPAGWVEVQEKLAAAAGLSVLLVDGRQPPAVVASNNNSICHAFQSSPELVGLCDPYCGDAHRRAMSAGTVVQYKCHAGLQCFTMPVQIAGEQNLAAIGGRAFISGADYRALVDRFRAGELNELLDNKPFENVIFAEAQRLDQLSERLDKAALSFDQELSPAPQASAVVQIQDEQIAPAEESPDLPIEVRIPDKSEVELLPVASDSELQREVDRLRVELEYRSQLADSLQRFLERISSTEPAKTYEAILVHAKELLQADRVSLWVYDEETQDLTMRASAGFERAAEVTRARLGEGTLGRVLEGAKPLVVEDLETSGMIPAPAHRNYRTRSFISYPIMVGSRKIGVLNLTDKQGGRTFDDVDLSLLEIVGPHIAVALERAAWQERATQFQLMSITDPLTGLLNRRYLEERLTEELNRSKRYNYSMSCLMIDIDDFKKYNDTNGHPAGDVALKITAHCLKAALRSADIACRYGGEEFCILLPQTTLSEAGVIAERMRQRVQETVYPHGKSQPMGSVSISIGISTFARHIDTAESVIAAADRALYNAKHHGKNRIEFYIDNLSGAATK